MTRFWNIPVRPTALAVLVLGLLAGCGDPPSSGGADGTLRIVLPGEPANIDPARAIDESSSGLARQVFQTLYRYQYLSREATLRPDLALAMPEVSDDQLTYTVQIRSDQRFADDPAFDDGIGRPIVAGDVAYSFKRHLDPATGSAWQWLFKGRIQGFQPASTVPFDYDQPLAGIEVVDEHTLRFRLVEPFPAFPHLLAVAGAGIVPREAVLRYGEQFGRTPVGSGPYRLTHLDGTGATLAKNTVYHERFNLAAEGYRRDEWPELTALESLDGAMLPFMDQIETYFIVDNIPAFLMASASPPADILRISAEASKLWDEQRPDSHRLASISGPSVVRFVLNLDGPLGVAPTGKSDSDMRTLRCAMGHAMDWEGRNRIFYDNRARIHPGIILPGLGGFEEDIPKDSIRYAPELAMTMLNEAHWTQRDLPTIRYGYQGGILEQQGFEHFRGMMVAIGWPGNRIKPAVYPSFGDLSGAALRGEIDVYLRAWILDYPDAENVLGLYYGPNAPGTNFERYRNPAYDRLFEQIQSMQPGPSRSAAMSRMNRMLIDDCVFLGSVFRQSSRALNKDLLIRGDASGPLAGTYWRFVTRQ